MRVDTFERKRRETKIKIKKHFVRDCKNGWRVTANEQANNFQATDSDAKKRKQRKSHRVKNRRHTRLFFLILFAIFIVIECRIFFFSFSLWCFGSSRATNKTVARWFRFDSENAWQCDMHFQPRTHIRTRIQAPFTGKSRNVSNEEKCSSFGTTHSEKPRKYKRKRKWSKQSERKQSVKKWQRNREKTEKQNQRKKWKWKRRWRFAFLFSSSFQLAQNIATQ